MAAEYVLYVTLWISGNYVYLSLYYHEV